MRTRNQLVGLLINAMQELETAYDIKDEESIIGWTNEIIIYAKELSELNLVINNKNQTK